MVSTPASTSRNHSRSGLERVAVLARRTRQIPYRAGAHRRGNAGEDVTADRIRARAIGYALHFLFGLLFALGYYAIFVVIDRSGVLLGGLFGLVHALFAGSALVNVLLPVVHPRIGTGFDAAGSAPLLEPPGFMLVNYGSQTRLATIVAHVAFGAIQLPAPPSDDLARFQLLQQAGLSVSVTTYAAAVAQTGRRLPALVMPYGRPPAGFTQIKRAKTTQRCLAL
jgi:hypothetical protein